MRRLTGTRGKEEGGGGGPEGLCPREDAIVAVKVGECGHVAMLALAPACWLPASVRS